MEAKKRLVILVCLMFGLLACLASPVSPVHFTPVQILNSPVQNPLQYSPSVCYNSLSCDASPPGYSSSSLSSNAKLNVSSHGYSPLVEDSVLIGPHVTLSGTWNPLNIPGFPTLKVKQTCIEFSDNIEQEHYGTIYPPVQAGWAPDVNPREAYDYVWLQEGHEVYIEVEYGTWSDGEGSPLYHGVSDDIDLFVWPPGVGHWYNNSLVGGSTATCCANPERGRFVAPVTGNYTIGLDYYSGVLPMGWRCYVKAVGYFYGAIMDGRSAEYDTAEIGYNGAFDVRLRMITGTSLDMDDDFSTHVIENVEIINFFPPTITLLNPGTTPSIVYGDGLMTINWNCSDPNTDEKLQYSVEISNNLGDTWKIIAYTTENYTVWDPTSSFYGMPYTPFEADGTRIPNFLARVNVTDGMFCASDTSDRPWILEGPWIPSPPSFELIIVILVAVVVIILIIIDVAVFLQRRYLPKKAHPRKRKIKLMRREDIISN